MGASRCSRRSGRRRCRICSRWGEISLGQQWKGGVFPVLVIYGTASPITTARQSQYLVELINRWRPGRAKYVEVAGMGTRPGEVWVDGGVVTGSGEFHAGLMEVVIGWIEGVLDTEAQRHGGKA